MESVCKSRNCLNCFVKSPLFKLMTKEELDAIEATRCEVVFKPDEIIYKQGTATSQIVTITDGLVKAYIEGYSEKNFIVDLIRPYTLISGPGIYVDYKHHFTLKAIEKTSCCFFSVKVFKEIVSKNSKVSEAVIELISSRAISYFDKFLFLTQKQVTGRIAGVLIYLNEQIYLSNPMQLTISYMDIAEMTGMTKDSVVRVLKDFCNEEVIQIDNSSVKILDFKKLKLFSEMG